MNNFSRANAVHYAIWRGRSVQTLDENFIEIAFDQPMNFRAEDFILIDVAAPLENLIVNKKFGRQSCAVEFVLSNEIAHAEQHFNFARDFRDDFGRCYFHRQPPSGIIGNGNDNPELHLWGDCFETVYC